MKNNSVIFPVLLVGVLLLFLFNCKKEDIKTAPTVTIAAVTNITATTATSGGEITSDGGASVTSRGVCWSANQNPTTQDTKTSNSTGTGSFTSSLTELTPGATYYLKAYATNSIGTAYSSQISLTTLALAPVLTTTAASAILSTTATSGGIISNNGGAAVTVSGVCWGTSTNPTTALSTKTTDGSLTGTFTGSITGLTPGTIYYVRAYATNSIGTGYGNEITVTTTAVIPVLTTTVASAILSTTATSGGIISSNGGAAVTVSGVCWGTSISPTTALSTKTINGSLTGTFTGSITGLTPGTIYYVRAYATNSAGTAYGNEVNFTTTYSYIVLLESNPLAGGITIGTGTFNSGASVTVYALANAGYTFTNWTMNGMTVSTMAGYTFMISGNRILVANFTTTSTASTVTDIDGNVYNTVTIGTQVWMTENLKTTKYRNGDPIPNVTDNTAWTALTTGAYCNYNNDAAIAAVYGKLYNWYAATDARNLAPAGWHVATDAEWTTLTTYLGDYGIAGGKLKETGTSHWYSPNAGATNETGFTALPGGYRCTCYSSEAFDYVGSYGIWWSSSEYSTTYAWSRVVNYDNSSVNHTYDGKRYGFSVRCVRDF